VFAIRRGPWKYIEGIPVDEIKPGARKARAEEYRAQLYNLADDPAESKDVRAAHPDVAKELAALLERYRDGGYSREIPPVAAKSTAAIELPPLAGKVVFSDAMDKVPGDPWVQVRGKWAAKNNAVWGTQKPSDQAVAALRHPLAMADGDIQYELSLPQGVSHTLRFTTKERDHVVHVQISAHKIVVSDQSTGKVLAQVSAKLASQTFLPVRACFRSNDLFVQVADTTLKASAPILGEAKTAFALLVYGEDVGFRKVTVTTKE